MSTMVSYIHGINTAQMIPSQKFTNSWPKIVETFSNGIFLKF